MRSTRQWPLVSRHESDALQVKGIALPEQWATTWRKSQRIAFYRKAMRWGAEAIERHNFACGEFSVVMIMHAP
jgi:hypothetical protein